MATNRSSIKEVKIKLTGEFGKGFKDIVDNIKELNSGIKEITSNLKAFNDSVKTNFSSVTKTTEAASKSIKTVNKELEKTTKTTEAAGKKTKILGKAFEGIAGRMKIFFQYRIINATTQAINDLVRSGIELESAFANIQAITRASDVEMGKLRNTILRVGEASKYSVEEIAKATTMLGQAGLTADEINDVLETTTQLAAGTGSELSNTVDLMTSALAVWGLNSEEASHLSDVMVTGMNRTKATLETFRMAVQYAGATMASLNVSFDEFASVAAAASNAGLRASVVGTGLRAMTSELISPTKKMVAGLAQLGLSTEDVNIESQGLVNVLYKLKNAGLTAANAYDLFGKRAAQFVLAAQGQLDVVDELRVAFNESGATLKAYGTQMDTISAQWQALKNTIKEIGYAIYDLINGPIREFLKVLNKMGQGLLWVFSDKDKLKFEELKKELEDSKNATKSFYGVVEQLSKRDYGENSKKAIDDLNDVIDKINEKFGKTIDYVKTVDDLADAYGRVKKELKDIESLDVEKLNESRLSRANQLIQKSVNIKKLTKISELLPIVGTKTGYAAPAGTPLLSGREAYEKTSSRYKEISKDYFNRLSSGESKRDIQQEIKLMTDLYTKRISQLALDNIQNTLEETGDAFKNFLKSDTYDKELEKIETETEEMNSSISGYAKKLAEKSKKLNEEEKKKHQTLLKSTQLSIKDITKITEDATALAEEIRKRKQKDYDKKWRDELEKQGVVTKEEQDSIIQEWMNLKQNTLKLFENLLNDIKNRALGEEEANINPTEAKKIQSAVGSAIDAVTSVGMTDFQLRQLTLGNLKDANKHSRKENDIIRERAELFNRKYLSQESAFETKEQRLKEDKARRTGFLSRMSDMGLDTALISAQYEKQSNLEDKRTAKAKLELLESYKKDYENLSKKVESGKITLKDADEQSASLISKMRDLEVETAEAKARFTDLDEVSLKDLDDELEKTKKETEDLEKKSQTLWGQFSGGFKKAVKDMVDSYSVASLGKLVAEDLGNGFSDALYSIVDGSKSAKDAFSDMARSILQDISKMLIRMAVMRTMFAFFGGSSGGAVTESGGVNSWSNVALTEANGGFIPKLRAAAGSMVRGGIQGKDSVPAMLMPGEYVLKKSAVDALGANFLNDLNNNAAQTLTNTSANLLQNPYESSSESEPAVVNVWVVSKEEEAQMGPNDIIATISKDIMTGGQTRRLIQSVVAGRK